MDTVSVFTCEEDIYDFSLRDFAVTAEIVVGDVGVGRGAADLYILNLSMTLIGRGLEHRGASTASTAVVADNVGSVVCEDLIQRALLVGGG